MLLLASYLITLPLFQALSKLWYFLFKFLDVLVHSFLYWVMAFLKLSMELFELCWAFKFDLSKHRVPLISQLLYLCLKLLIIIFGVEMAAYPCICTWRLNHNWSRCPLVNHLYWFMLRFLRIVNTLVIWGIEIRLFWRSTSKLLFHVSLYRFDSFYHYVFKLSLALNKLFPWWIILQDPQFLEWYFWFTHFKTWCQRL